MALDVAAVLGRIGLAAPPPPTADGLLALHRAYVARVPYEDLAIHLGEVGPLTVEHAAARILHGGRGGYCFEVNGVLASLLDALGFAVERREARVGAREADGPTNHLALVVRDTGGGAWLAEAGYGEGWVDPLPLRAGTHAQGPSCRVFCSQPFISSPSQSAQPGKHAPISHMLLLQTGSACGGASHGFRQSPQWSGSLVMS